MRGTLGTPERLNLPLTLQEGAALAHRFELRLWLVRLFGAIGVGGLLSIVANATGAGTDPDQAHAVRNVVATVILQATYTAVFATASFFGTRVLLRPVTRWLIAAREPTSEECDALGGLPRRIVIVGLVWWASLIPVAIAMYYGILHEHYPVSVFLLGVCAQVVAMAATGSLVVYLLAERVLRPLTGLASRGSHAPRPSSIGALPRLLMAFGRGRSPARVGGYRPRGTPRAPGYSCSAGDLGQHRRRHRGRLRSRCCVSSRRH